VAGFALAMAVGIPKRKLSSPCFFFVLSTFRDHSSGVENVVVALPALAWSAEPLVALY
jgi:hypothetical protein